MGRISDFMCEAAKEYGAVIRTNSPVDEIYPGVGVRLANSSEMLQAKVIVSNADPRTALRLLGNKVDSGWRDKVLSVPMISSTVKVNVALNELPNFTARPGINEIHHKSAVNIPLSAEEWKQCFETIKKGELPNKLWCEIYFQTAVDNSVSHHGLHHMSVFAQHVPYPRSGGRKWDNEFKEQVGRVVLNSIARHCSNIPRAVVDVEVFGPPDVEKEIGLYGGHIFQGECLPDYMWDRRLAPGTPMKGFYLCGASTHPGGSVIGINGRNAAMKILEDLSLNSKL